MATFINPFTDFGFKKIFGQEVDKDVLIDFLNSLLVGERHIVDITFLDKESLADHSDGRKAIFDIYCRTDSGEYIIVEMQNGKQERFLERMLYYTTRSIATQGDKGTDWGYEVNAVYGVALMNFVQAKLKKFRTDFTLADRDDPTVMSDKLRMIFLQLPLFEKDGIDDESTDFEKWIYVLKNMETLKRMPKAAQKAVFQKLASIASIANLTPEERQVYDRDLKTYRDTLVFEKEEKERIEKAKECGKIEGMRMGREEGRMEEKKQIVLTMVENDVPFETISLYTGLSTEEIAEIVKGRSGAAEA